MANVFKRCFKDEKVNVQMTKSTLFGMYLVYERAFNELPEDEFVHDAYEELKDLVHKKSLGLQFSTLLMNHGVPDVEA